MYVRVHAYPGAKKEKVTSKKDSVFEISVKEPAERNLANKRIRQILAEFFSVPVTQVTMLTGHQSSSKMFSIENESD
jgi:uncharacterized protein YggU (UPF0235/DUF167 family)